ncbi:MAG: FecR domain-containing protein [Spirochaetaceae bacterium]|nr:FecR domain-containing protein [Spirochaetaceae bacterium]
MKKIVTILVLLAVAFYSFALDGIVMEVLGKVEKQVDNSWIALKKGDVLVPGDIVSTGFKSEAVISIGESVITVKALTRMTIEQLYEKNKNHVSSVYLDVGSVSADVKPVTNKRVGFTVKTPAVTASVRGTAGIVYAYGKVEGIRGKWGLSAPQPKLINLNRGDVVALTESVENQTMEGIELNQEQLENVVEEIDEVLESMLSAPAGVAEVFVNPGEVAFVNPVETDAIVSPQEVKKDEATSVSGENNGGNSTDKVNDAVSSKLTQYTDIFVEIVLPPPEE